MQLKPTKLTAIAIKNLSKPGMHPDGNGLYLIVSAGGAKSWKFRYRFGGARRDMGLGNFDPQENNLAKAREKAQDARQLIAKGIDPIEAKKPTALPVVVTSEVPTFAVQAKLLIDAMAPGWRGKKTRAGWERSLLVHAKKLGNKLVNEITVADVVEVVRPYWIEKPESGGKMRERIETVLDSARADGHITGLWENPARWKGNLIFKLPKRQKLSRGHFEALPYAKAPAFWGRLREQHGMGAIALQFTTLTTARENMIIGAEWKEIKGDVWTIPGDRMKGGKPFEIPLTADALAILDHLKVLGKSGYIFKGMRKGTHISNATMDAVLKRMKVKATPHGFRSTFRDWAGDETEHPREIAEMCLAHAVGDEVERAYRRADAMRKRRVLLQDWADYLFKRQPEKAAA